MNPWPLVAMLALVVLLSIMLSVMKCAHAGTAQQRWLDRYVQHPISNAELRADARNRVKRECGRNGARPDVAFVFRDHDADDGLANTREVGRVAVPVENPCRAPVDLGGTHGLSPRELREQGRFAR